MFKVKIITLGKLKEPWLQLALKEYEERLKGKVKIEWLIAKDEKQLEQWAKEKPFVALDPRGELFTSEEWSKKMHQLGADLRFVIGGAEGLCPNLKKEAKLLWSLSPLTFTHQMTRLILSEQIYRAIEIEGNTNYHK